MDPSVEKNRNASKEFHQRRQRMTREQLEAGGRGATAKVNSIHARPELAQIVRANYRQGMGRRPLLVVARQWALLQKERPPSMYELRRYLKAIDNDGVRFDRVVGDVVVRL